MNICIFSYCCAIIIPLLGFHTYGFPQKDERDEGSKCQTEHGISGICKKLPDCPARLQEAMQAKRGNDALGRCRFGGSIEIVCCAHEKDKIKDTTKARPAELEKSREPRKVKFGYNSEAFKKSLFK